MTLGELLDDYKSRNGLSEREVGERLINKRTGLPASQTSVNRWVHGDDVPGPDWHDSFATALGMSREAVSLQAGREKRARSKRAERARMDRMESDLDDLKKTLRTILDRLPGD